MKKNTLKKAMSALAVAAVAASVSSMAVAAADYPTEPADTYGTAGVEGAVQPKITISVDGEDGGKVYNLADIAGKKAVVTVNVSGADSKYASTGLHIYFDKRLTLDTVDDELAVEAGPAVKSIMPDTATPDPTASEEDMTGFFVATAGKKDAGKDGVMWQFELTVPENAAEGDVYGLDIIYKSTEAAEDLFVNKAVDTDGLNMQANAFINGIYNSTNANAFAQDEKITSRVSTFAENFKTDWDGYIAIADTVVTEPTTTPAPTTAAPTTAAPASSGAAASSAAASSSAKASSSTTKAADAPKTGVAGCGVAVAGLAVALGTAFALRKKED